MNDYQSLINTHMSLANRIAGKEKKKLPPKVTYDEVQSAAYLGLVQAAKKYDPENDASFETFASFRIIGAIKDYLREIGWGPRNERRSIASLDATTPDGICLADTLEARAETEEGDIFEKCSTCLSPLARQALKLYYLDGLKMKEVAHRLSLTESRISQIVSESKRELRTVWSHRADELRLEVA